MPASLVRFNPACAGNSASALSTEAAKAVQPRLRGELFKQRQFINKSAGSTPLARGTRRRSSGERNETRFNPACAGNSYAAQDVAAGVVRFNPACAGNSSKGRSTCRFLAVQPRLRGELGLIHSVVIPLRGSTPLARGTHPLIAIRPRRFRFNPACAGNSEFVFSGVVLESGSTPLARGTLLL